MDDPGEVKKDVFVNPGIPTTIRKSFKVYYLRLQWHIGKRKF
jgi:hypothetical protein